MRALTLGFMLLLTIAIAAQSDSKRATPTNTALAVGKPAGTLLQMMRGTLFPNANIIFDVQQRDPGAPVKPGETAIGATETANFANVYTGWQVIENAAVALDEAVDGMLKAGRLCSNGTPVPIDRPDYVRAAQGLRQTARTILEAAQAQDREKVGDLSNDLSDACAACHEIYRDPEGPKGFGDTSLRCKVALRARG
jgi:hypothetical protein